MADSDSKMTTGRRATETGCDSAAGRDSYKNEITEEMIAVGVRFLEDWGGGASEFAYPSFVAEFLKALNRSSSADCCKNPAPKRWHRRSISGET